MASIGFMLGVVRGELSGSSVLAGAAFVVVGTIMLRGALSMARDWDEQEPRN